MNRLTSELLAEAKQLFGEHSSRWYATIARDLIREIERLQAELAACRAKLAEAQTEVAALKAELAEAKRLCGRHAAEVNRRRGEMSVARQALDVAGVPKENAGITLTMSQRINLLRAQMP